MPNLGQDQIRNSLLSAVPADYYELIRPHLERVMLNKHDVLVVPNEPIGEIHFFETAIASMVMTSPEGYQAEIGMVGCEGMSAITHIHDTDRAPYEVVIQVEGDSLRMSAEAFRTLKAESPTFNSLMLRFAQALQIQTAYTALSNARHGIEERLARWLLMSHDRSEGDTMSLTHEFMAIMLAVHRPTVTTALHVLEGMDYIRAQRGKVLIRDRRALEDFARDAYGVPEAEYVRLIGPMPKAATFAAAMRAREANQARIDALKQGGGDKS